MDFKDSLKMALKGLMTHKSRSALTILGIVIGITSITLVMSIGDSAQNLILGEVQGLGTKNVFVIPGRMPTGPSSSAETLFADSIKEKDIQDLQKKSNVPDAVQVVPFVFGPATLNYGSEVYRSTIMGGNEFIFNIYNLDVKEGDFFTKEDVSQKSDVVILGSKVAKELFGFSDPVGEKIKIKNKNFRIIGVLAVKSQSPFVNFDESVIAPYTTVQEYILGIKYVQRVAIEASTTDVIPGMIKDIETLLRNNHNISDPSKDDFFIQTQADLMKMVGTVTTILTVLLTSIAAISLIVGGVGIMNIMLVSVTERTREIGLRKALGATNKDILLQFLTEAVILTLLGGIVGVILGISFSFIAIMVAAKLTGVNFVFFFPLIGILLGVGVSLLIGLTFGIFPARQASLKSPMEALRYE